MDLKKLSESVLVRVFTKNRKFLEGPGKTKRSTRESWPKRPCYWLYRFWNVNTKIRNRSDIYNYIIDYQELD